MLTGHLWAKEEWRGWWSNLMKGQRKPCVRNHGKKNTQRKREGTGEEGWVRGREWGSGGMTLASGHLLPCTSCSISFLLLMFPFAPFTLVSPTFFFFFFSFRSTAHPHSHTSVRAWSVKFCELKRLIVIKQMHEYDVACFGLCCEWDIALLWIYFCK